MAVRLESSFPVFVQHRSVTAENGMPATCGLFSESLSVFIIIIIIIIYIYHALINTLSAHIIRINLNMIFYIYRYNV